MEEHEYALLGGINRATIGRYLAIVSAAASSLLVWALSSLIDLGRQLGAPINITPALFSLISASAIFTFLYWLFNKYIWKYPPISNLLKTPDLSGSWKCYGKKLNQDGSVELEWDGELTIIQSWDKFRVRLLTKSSASNSITAALAHDAADGYRLLYSYRNEPKIDQPELASHRGYASILFTPSLKTGNGEYFNGAGRISFGTMQLKRK